jgi:hypothetical protein
MFNLIGTDINIVDAMHLVNICQTSWTESFLAKTLALIQQIKMMKYTIETITHHQKKLLPIQDNLLFVAFINAFQKPELIRQYLDQWQYNVVKQVYNSGVIRTVDDFNYMMHHLPFFTEINELITDYIINNTQIPIIYKNHILGPYVSPVILKWMFGHCHYLDTYQVMLRDGKSNPSGQLITIDILHQHPKDNLWPTIKTMCNINLMLQNVYHIPHPDKSQPLHIIYIMTPFKKKLNYFQPNDRIDRQLIPLLRSHRSLKYNYTCFNNPISTINVNTGVTVKHQEQYITLWRTEEVMKVLTHELIHYYGLEKGQEFRPLALNISNNFRHYSKELFTEIQTWYIYIVYQLSQQHYHLASDDIRFILDYERTYSLMKMHRILKQYHIEHLDQFLSDDQQYTINVQSSVLYYYILKAVLLSCIDPFSEDLLYPSAICAQCRHKLPILVSQRLQSLLHSQFFTQLFDDLLDKHPGVDDGLKMMGLNLINIS